MKTPYWLVQTICTQEGFTLKLSFEKEDMDPRDHFLNVCGWSKEQYSEVKNLYWFTAKVTAYKGKIECGSAYLGGNAYKTLKEVLGDNPQETGLSGYMPQLIEEAIDDAKENLDDLDD